MYCGTMGKHCASCPLNRICTHRMVPARAQAMAGAHAGGGGAHSSDGDQQTRKGSGSLSLLTVLKIKRMARKIKQKCIKRNNKPMMKLESRDINAANNVDSEGRSVVVCTIMFRQGKIHPIGPRHQRQYFSATPYSTWLSMIACWNKTHQPACYLLIHVLLVGWWVVPCRSPLNLTAVLLLRGM